MAEREYCSPEDEHDERWHGGGGTSGGCDGEDYGEPEGAGGEVQEIAGGVGSEQLVEQPLGRWLIGAGR